ncbi:MAG: zinc-binding dehydrogenase [Phycisphaerae bacterium]|nr:zinc-binding dehydrogenase [Phycisphaerae bacterium]
MKAAVVESRGRLVVRDVPEPKMGEYDCLCETLYGATCSGTDVHLIENHSMPFEYSYPMILGHESIGRVLEVGAKVKQFRVGDLVTRVVNYSTDDLASFWGGFAERSLVSDHEVIKKETGREIGFSDGIHKVLPAEIDPAGATMVITWRETLSFLQRIGVAPGAAVLVIGSGGNGFSFANHARNFGAGKIVMIGSDSRREVARRVGAAALFSYKLDDVAGAIRDAGFGPFDLILDAVGQAGQIDRVLPLLKPGGQVAMYGVDDFGKVTINPSRAPGSFTFANPGYNEGEAHDAVVSFLREGKLRPGDFCDLETIYPLESIHDAFAAVRQRKAVKAVVRLGEE